MNMEKSTDKITISLDGLSCTACELKIEKVLKKLDGVLDAKVTYSSSTADIVYIPEEVDLDTMYEAIEHAGYSVIISDENSSSDEDASHSTTIMIALILVGLYVIINNTIGFNFFPQITQSMGYGMLFVAGLFTSVHCIAMCGGINLSQCAGCNGCDEGISQSRWHDTQRRCDLFCGCDCGCAV